MTEELSFQVYLSISQKKFEIYLLDKQNFKNIYKQELFFENDKDIIDYNLLSSFLDKNIFKLEKLIGNFLKSVVVIIENKQILDFSLGIKKQNYGEKINKYYLESSLAELNDLFKENYQNNKILHFVVSRYLVDEVEQTSFDEQLDGDHMCVEVNFISAPKVLIKEISNVLQKYQIKVDRLFEKKYIENFFEGKILDLSIIAYKIQSGYNHNEVVFVQKNTQKRGFFEKFFQLFS